MWTALLNFSPPGAISSRPSNFETRWLQDVQPGAQLGPDLSTWTKHCSFICQLGAKITQNL
eukprot:9168957-Karenia_brevis.AAC.2